MVFISNAPADMLLKIQREGGSWKGRLEWRFHSKDVADESFDLQDMVLTAGEITFTYTKSVSDLKIHFRRVIPRTGELIGNADATLERPGSPPIRLLGRWQLRKKIDLPVDYLTRDQDRQTEGAILYLLLYNLRINCLRVGIKFEHFSSAHLCFSECFGGILRSESLGTKVIEGLTVKGELNK